MPSVMTILGYSLVSLPYCYFLNRFLVPKYNKNVIIFLYWFTFFLFSAGIYVYLFDQAAVKPILMALELYVSNVFLYKGTKLKKLIAVLIMLPTSVLLELPFSFGIAFIAKLDTDYLFHSYWFILLQIVSDILLFLFLKLELLLFKDQGNYIKKYASLFVVICAQYFMIVFCWSQLQLMEIVKTPFMERAQYIFIMAIISFVLDIVLLYLLHKLYHKTKMDIVIQKMELEYQILLDEYIEDKNDDEVFRFLRHDIMNFMIHGKLLQEKNDQLLHDE